MVDEERYIPAIVMTVDYITCQECSTLLGGLNGKDPYSHMLGCLNVEPNALHRIKSEAIARGNENGKRILHIVNFLLGEK